jgi:hypothetical protein
VPGQLSRRVASGHYRAGMPTAGEAVEGEIAV